MPVFPSAWRWWALTIGLFAQGLQASGQMVEQAATVPPEEWPKLRERTFAVVWETVNETYFDVTFGGVDWVAMKEKYRARLPEMADNDALRGLLQSMLGELRRTHFAIMPREAAVFTPAERTRIGTTGAEVAFVEGVVAVNAISAGSPAARAGLLPGDTIVQIDDLDLNALSGYFAQADLTHSRRGFCLTQTVSGRLRRAVGSIVKLEVRGVDGAHRSVDLVCEANEGPWSEPMGDFPSMPVECTARHDVSGLGYLHFNIFARPAMKSIRTLLHALPADGGLVFDLRGNLGGISVMAPGIRAEPTGRADGAEPTGSNFGVWGRRRARLHGPGETRATREIGSLALAATGMDELRRQRHGHISLRARLPTSLFELRRDKTARRVGLRAQLRHGHKDRPYEGQSRLAGARRYGNG